MSFPLTSWKVDHAECGLPRAIWKQMALGSDYPGENKVFTLGDYESNSSEYTSCFPSLFHLPYL